MKALLAGVCVCVYWVVKENVFLNVGQKFDSH